MKKPTAEELRTRTKQYALRIINLCRSLPDRPEGWVIGKQLLRAGTSVGANYRAACRARSHAEFLAKLCIVVEEADETLYWFELLVEANMVSRQKLRLLVKEDEELVAIFAAARKTAQENQVNSAEQSTEDRAHPHRVTKSASHQV